MGLHIFKLEKLRIEAFTDADRSRPAGVFDAMFNPSELEWRHEIKWGKSQAVNSVGKPQTFSHIEPSDLTFKLLFDGTGTDELGVMAIGRPSVFDRIKKLKAIAYDSDGTIHQPKFLRLKWGATLSFDCRLCTLNIKYTLFDRDASPLRAEVEVAFHGEMTPGKAAKTANNQSPDLTHARVVKAGDTLPLLTESIYGSPAHYLHVARYNGLDDFREITPGMELLFPPLVVFTRAAGQSS